MAAPATKTGPDVPTWLRVVGIVFAGLLLTTFFIHRGFPYDKLRDVVADRASRASHMRITIGELAPGLGLRGPHMAALSIVATPPNADPIQIDRIALRLGGSLSWLRGAPAVFTEADTPFGLARGMLTLDDDPAWSGELLELDLAALPIGGRWGETGVDGILDITLDLRFTDAGVEGTVHFEGGEGSLSLAALPIPVPYDSVRGDLTLGGKNTVTVESVEFEGDLISGSLSGTVGPGRFWTAPLDLDVQLDVDPALHSGMRALGARVNRRGSTRIRVSGTPSEPTLR